MIIIIDNNGIFALGMMTLSHLKPVKRLGRRGGRDCVHTLRYLFILSTLRACSTDHRVGEDAGSESQGGGGSETD